MEYSFSPSSLGIPLSLSVSEREIIGVIEFIISKFHPDVIGRLEQGVTRSGATRSGVEAFDAVLGEMGGVTIESIADKAAGVLHRLW